jgi:DNA end-binding protein Ku
MPKKNNRSRPKSDAGPDELENGAEKGTHARRAIWKGSITIGLVNIPVSLHSAESKDEISFRLLDRRTLAPVRYKRVNESTGREVPWDQIVKGYEHKRGEFVVMSDEEIRRANVEATQTVEITDVVDGSEISAIYYERPYYLVPDKKARKSYALLREVLHKSGKVGIARIVLRSRQYIAAVLPVDRVLVVHLLRYAHELRDAGALDLPAEGTRANGISDGEVKMAERLVEAMYGEWNPEKYRDEYRDDLLAVIEHKVESGQTEVVVDESPVTEKRPAKVVDIMELLKRSVQQAEKAEPKKRSETGRRRAG